MEIEGHDMKIMFHNSNGFPSNKNNRHKIKEYNRLLEDKQMAIIIETGMNEHVNPMVCNDKMEITRKENMMNTERHEYQHNGSGTMILTEKGVKT